MENDKKRHEGFKLSIAGFVAGFVATLTFHQLALWLLWGIGLAPFSPYNMTAVPPMGVPAVISLAFWGGIWGIIFTGLYGLFPKREGYWVTAFLFGAILPSLAALLIVLPLKGRPMGGGWQISLLATMVLVNGIWGLTTGALIRLYEKMSQERSLLAAHCGPEMLCEK